MPLLMKMKLMKIFKIIISLFLLIAGNVSAQEFLTGISVNEEVAGYSKTHIEKKKNCGCGQKSVINAKTLPFFDDFSVSKIVPDTTKWIDHDVFVNENFAYRPLNKGVATFDALDSTGKIYDNADYIAFEADKLTSVPLRTDSVFVPVVKKLVPADSLYFSFFYQPQGIANDPEVWDTLVLEFAYYTGDTVFSHVDSIWVSASTYLENEQDTIFPLDTLWAPPGCNPNMYKVNFQTIVWGDWIQMPCDSVMVPEKKWQEVWKSEGMTLAQFQEKYGKDFVEVMIPVTDPKFFYNGFQFRFRNYASIANDIIPEWKSNVDQWNIDLVYLNYNRTYEDTTFRMLSFSERAPSFLKNYEVMPYRQYRADPINTVAPQIQLYISNLDKIEHNTKYRYDVYGSDGTYYFGYDGGSCNLSPVYTSGFQNCNTTCGAAHACPPVNSTFNVDYSVDTASFIIKHYISDSSQSNILVDSAIYGQGFYNYFAYDDGTPELGYSLEPAYAQLAYKFKLTMPDTLWGLQIYFNRTQNDANAKYFNLMVWKDNNGTPGEVLYKEEGKKVDWSEGMYAFYPYMLDKPLVVSGTVYVGIEQTTQGGLNIGFDANHDKGDKIFYNVEDNWYQSAFSGALLIRPIIGSSLVLDVKELNIGNSVSLKIYPNPAGNTLYFNKNSVSEHNAVVCRIVSLFGSVVKEFKTNDNRIDISDLSNGMYILQIATESGFYSKKFIKKNF